MLIGHRLHLPAGPVGSAQESGRAQGAAESGKVGDAGSELDPHRLREVTFIGAGSSIAYLANEMAGRFEGVGADQPLLGKVSVIGVEDAWSPSVRGQGYINHQNEIIGQWGERAGLRSRLCGPGRIRRRQWPADRQTGIAGRRAPGGSGERHPTS
ncbi:hypothetical protein [Chromobacterium violaceum]|uniref:hypothetical protein n=1 Tax=Chromobacterium violaceum TaxID=536 RepID=UPI0009F106B1|nr:hypothetical protein [Chromobacterium violaceum]OQS26855.1 hypothetical protein B0T41_10290 [Chromobacterium violaceum]